MEEIFARLGGDSQFVLLALIFGAVFLVAAGIGFLVTRSPASARLEAGSKPEASTLNVGVKLRPKAGRWFDNILVKRAIEPFVPHDEANLSSLRKRLVQAGYMQPWAVTALFISRIVCAIMLPILALIFVPVLSSGGVTVNRLLIVCGLAALVGLYLPTMWIIRKTDYRQQTIRRALPDALDMMLVCVEAGLGLDAATARVATELERAHPLLAQQFNYVGLELRAGRSREQALRAMADRIGIDEVSSLVTVIVQSEVLGTSLGQALRVYAEEMRQKRLMAAEEKANMLPVKLAIPLVIFILPALMTVVMSPAVIKVIRILLPIMRRSGGGG